MNVGATSGLESGLGLKLQTLPRSSDHTQTFEKNPESKEPNVRRVPGTTESAMEEYQEYQHKIGPTRIINHCLGVVAEIYTSSSAKQKKNVIQADFASAAVHSRTADNRMAAHYGNKPSSDRCHLLFMRFLLG